MTEGGGFGGGADFAKDSGEQSLPASQGKGVFVSHASEDAPLAEAFRELIQDVSSGIIPTYSSSSRDKAAGIPYGDDWFAWIEKRIRESGNLVALITPASIGRPWILFEAGFGRALSGVRVFGLRLGTDAADAYVGPFKAFHNSGSDPDELVKLCRQLFDGTQCHPRDEMLKLLVEQFRAKIQTHLESANVESSKANPESEAVFKALEEMKAIASARSARVRDESDEYSMMELDRLMQMATSVGRNVEPGLRAKLLMGVCEEAGFGWIVPAANYLLDSPRKFTISELVRSIGMISRKGRRLPFPPDFLFEELSTAIQEHHSRFKPSVQKSGSGFLTEPGEDLI